MTSLSALRIASLRPSGRGQSLARCRRRTPLAWLLIAVFAFAQLAIPAYACAAVSDRLALSAEAAVDTVVGALGSRAVHHDHAVHIAAAGPGDDAAALGTCAAHAPESSLLCFKHCHPEDETLGSLASAVAPIAPPPALVVAAIEPWRPSVQFRPEHPGLPPPPLIRFCRLLN